MGDGSHHYHKGEKRTVVYDRAHPDRIRAVREANQNGTGQSGLGLLFVAGLFLLAGGATNLVRAFRQQARQRAHAAAETRTAIVTESA